jgi:DNA repair protein RecO (recombination protein O)
MESAERALVLKVGRFREADAWVRFLSPAKGVLSAFAFGGMKSRRRFPGCLDALNLVLFSVGRTRRGTYPVLEEGSLIHGFPGLKRDNARLGLAVNCLKFAEAVQIGPQGARRLYDLLLATLYALEGCAGEPVHLPLLFRARVAFEQGYWPELSACRFCGRELAGIRSLRFLVEKGGIACAECSPRDGLGLAVSQGTVQSLQWIAQSPPADWPRLCLPLPVRRQCYDIVERFVAFHLGLCWDNGAYRKV